MQTLMIVSAASVAIASAGAASAQGVPATCAAAVQWPWCLCSRFLASIPVIRLLLVVSQRLQDR